MGCAEARNQVEEEAAHMYAQRREREAQSEVEEGTVRGG